MQIRKCANAQKLKSKFPIANLQMCKFADSIARALGFEPRSRVLETRMLAVAPCPQEKPLNPLKGTFEVCNNLKNIKKNKVLKPLA